MTNTQNQRKLFGILSIGLAAIGLVLGLIMKKPILDTFNIGGWLSFVAFLVSLGAVEDEGGNFLAKIAFWISFIALVVTIFVGAAFR